MVSAKLVIPSSIRLIERVSGRCPSPLSVWTAKRRANVYVNRVSRVENDSRVTRGEGELCGGRHRIGSRHLRFGTRGRHRHRVRPGCSRRATDASRRNSHNSAGTDDPTGYDDLIGARTRRRSRHSTQRELRADIRQGGTDPGPFERPGVFLRAREKGPPSAAPSLVPRLLDPPPGSGSSRALWDPSLWQGTPPRMVLFFLRRPVASTTCGGISIGKVASTSRGRRSGYPGTS